MKRLTLLLLPLLTASAAGAQHAAGEASTFPGYAWTLGLIIFAGLLVIWAFWTMFGIVRQLDAELRVTRRKLDGTWMEPEAEPQPEAKSGEPPEVKPLFGIDWTRAVPVEDEASITFDHDYDGIQELDNDLPPWWSALFVGTIIFSVFYLLHFHVFETGLSSHERYEKSVLVAELAAEERAASGERLTSENVTRLQDEGSLQKGEAIFMKHCATCHDHAGGGMAGAGPNLTDPYWLHGGGISNIYLTIRQGVPEKGMISWADQLLPREIQQVASYILTLEGTNPPNPQPPQGEIWTPEEETPAGEGAPADTTGAMPAEAEASAGPGGTPPGGTAGL